MENLKIEKNSIYWERTKTKHDSIILYKNEILRHDDHFSISKIMFVDGEIKHSDLTSIPIELIDKLKDLKQ